MPWPRKQAVAILLKAKRKGDKKLTAKAKASIGPAAKRRKR